MKDYMLFSSFLKKKKLLIVAVVFIPGTFFGMQNHSNQYLIFKGANGFSFENIQTGIDFNGCSIKNVSNFEKSRWNCLTTKNFYENVAKVPLVKPSEKEQSLEYPLQKSQADKNSVTGLELSPSQSAEARRALLLINKSITNQSEKRPNYYDLSLDDDQVMGTNDDDQEMDTNKPGAMINDVLPVFKKEPLYYVRSSIDIFDRQ